MIRTITDVKPQVKNAKRCSIYLDGSFYCGMELITVVKNRLKVGMQIEETELGRIQLESERTTAMDKAMTFLSRSIKTSKQVADKLKTYGYTLEVIDSVIEKLKEYGYVDDENFSESYVNTYSKNKGKRLLEKELIIKGVDKQVARDAVGCIEDETQSALSVATKYLKNKSVTKENVQKAYRYLISKGFSYDTAKTVLQGFLQDEDYQD